jgi:putative exporter of polyketide antibiotics
MIQAWQIAGEHLDKFTPDDWLDVLLVLFVATVLIGISILRDSVEMDRRDPPKGTE